MTYFQALVLGLVQGLTEFLPISSSGHLIIVPEVFGWGQHPLSFDTTLHLGTAAAVVIYFYSDLIGISKRSDLLCFKTKEVCSVLLLRNLKYTAPNRINTRKMRTIASLR